MMGNACSIREKIMLLEPNQSQEASVMLGLFYGADLIFVGLICAWCACPGSIGARCR